MKNSLVARLENLGPAFIKAIEDAVLGVKKLVCPQCKFVHEYSVPTATSVRAALGGLDRIPGMGPHSTTTLRPGAPQGGDLQQLMDELYELPYGERCLIVKHILPEHSDVLDSIDSRALMSATSPPGVATN